MKPWGSNRLMRCALLWSRGLVYNVGQVLFQIIRARDSYLGGLPDSACGTFNCTGVTKLHACLARRYSSTPDNPRFASDREGKEQNASADSRHPQSQHQTEQVDRETNLMRAG